MATKQDGKKLEESWRKAIQATLILKRLSACALGQIEMTSQNIKAAEIILRKVVPDLASIQHEGNNGNHITVNIMRFTDAKPLLENTLQNDMMQQITNGSEHV